MITEKELWDLVDRLSDINCFKPHEIHCDLLYPGDEERCESCKARDYISAKTGEYHG